MAIVHFLAVLDKGKAISARPACVKKHTRKIPRQIYKIFLAILK
jgi:hypothetical protein